MSASRSVFQFFSGGAFEEMPAGSDKNSPRVNLYLFQVLPNASFRNADQPTRDGSGQLVQQPHLRGCQRHR